MKPSRRDFLGAMGLSAALGPLVPFLNRRAEAAPAEGFPRRLLILMTAHGSVPSEFWPTGGETDFTFTPDDNGTYVVSLTATDDDGGVGTAQTTINVVNVAPTPAITNAPSGDVNEGDTITLGSSVTDPGTADTVTGTINFGDGNTAPVSLTSTPTAISHPYANSGVYTAAVIIVLFWGSVALSSRGGLGLIAKLASNGTVIGTLIPGAILVVMGVLIVTGELTQLNVEAQRTLDALGLDFLNGI